MPKTVNVDVRQAGLMDVQEIAAAHLDSIRSIGPLYYPAQIVNDWCARVTGNLYVNAMAGGEKFFVAVDNLGGLPEVYGFSSHRVDGGEHGVAVYVRGRAARSGVGTALLRAAVDSAVAAGAASIHIDASLAAVEFYKANGFVEVGRGEHHLQTGRTMGCVFMRKNLEVP
jgi:putative acetyltransferase